MYNPYFVVLSNLIYLGCAIILFIRDKPNYSWSWEIFDCLTVAYISAMYHWCDSGSYCIAQYGFLQMADYFYSAIVITTAFTVHLGFRYSRLYKCLLNFMSLILVSFYLVDMSKTILPILVINGVCVLGYQAKEKFRRWKTKQVIYLTISISCVIAAYFMKINSTIENYAIYHSIWHMLTGISIIFSVLGVAKENSNKKSIHLPMSSSSKYYLNVVNQIKKKRTITVACLLLICVSIIIGILFGVGILSVPSTSQNNCIFSTSNSNVQLVVMGAGGHGGPMPDISKKLAGGGGSGQYIYYSNFTLTSQIYTITIGTPGRFTSFGTVAAAWGLNGTQTGPGGAGGDGSLGGSGSPGVSDCTYSYSQAGGGGGGISSAGGNGNCAGGGGYGGVGGAGVTNPITGTVLGGGGGGTSDGGGGPCAPGGGNGGSGGCETGGYDADGGIGAGGGGSSYGYPPFTGGLGGNGIVIISWVTSQACYTITGGIITTNGSNTIATFLTSGTLTALIN